MVIQRVRCQSPFYPPKMNGWFGRGVLGFETCSCHLLIHPPQQLLVEKGPTSRAKRSAIHHPAITRKQHTAATDVSRICRIPTHPTPLQNSAWKPRTRSGRSDSRMAIRTGRFGRSATRKQHRPGGDPIEGSEDRAVYTQPWAIGCISILQNCLNRKTSQRPPGRRGIE